MASGEMSAAEFEVFNAKWMAGFLPYIRSGGSDLSNGGLLGRLEHGREAEPQSPEFNPLDKYQSWRGTPLPIPQDRPLNGSLSQTRFRQKHMNAFIAVDRLCDAKISNQRA
jgi:hypothetical protein